MKGKNIDSYPCGTLKIFEHSLVLITKITYNNQKNMVRKLDGLGQFIILLQKGIVKSLSMIVES